MGWRTVIGSDAFRACAVTCGSELMDVVATRLAVLAATTDPIPR